MTQEDKELLFKDLSARLPYAVKVKIGNNLYIIYGIDIGLNDEGEWVPRACTHGMTAVEIEYCKPFLFPLSSMTKEQKREYNFLKHEVPVCYYEYGDVVEKIELYDSPESFQYLIENHFDYHGLIPMGLAIDATDKNIY